MSVDYLSEVSGPSIQFLSTLMQFVFFLQHFLREEPVVGIEYEAQLQKTLLPRKEPLCYLA